MHRRAVGVAVRAGTFGALALVAAAIGVVPPAGAAPGHPPIAGGPAAGADLAAPGPSAAPARRVLLVNGDQVLVREAAGRLGAVAVPPAAHAGLAGAVMSLGLGGQRYEIPAAALPYLGHGLDPHLFDLGSLLAHERDGRLPVRVSYRGHLPRLPGVIITRSGGGTAFGFITQPSSLVFGAALDRQYVADHARDSYGSDGMFAGGTTVGLAGAAPAVRPRLAAPMHTLTVKGINLAGRPDTGDGVLLLNVDNTRLLDPVASQQTFYHGVAKFSVPAGHYFGIGGFGAITLQGHPGPDTRYVVLPQFTVTGNTTVTMHETAADSKVTMVTPRPATVLTTDVWLRRTGTSGPPLLLELYPVGHPMWISPAQVKPTVGTLQVSVNQHLESRPGRKVPYEYTLSYTDAPGTIPVQRYVVSAKDLATVHDRFYQPVKASGAWAFNGSFTGTNANNNADWFGFIEPAGPGVKLPGKLTEYAGGAGSARMEWAGQYRPVPGVRSVLGDTRLLHPGEHLTDNWSAYPLQPGVNALLTSLPNMFWMMGANIPSAVRAGNTLQLEVDPFDDNEPGHQIGAVAASGPEQATGSYRIEQNGTTIASGDAVAAAQFGEFYTKVTLSPKPSTIRFSLNYTRASRTFPLSTATSTVWIFRSAPVTGATVPPGWSCVRYTYRPHGCTAQPMMILRYAVAHMRLDGAAPAGRQVLHLTAGHLQAATASNVTTASVSVSFDGGKTWHAAQVTGHDGSYTAAFTAPAGAKVTLRTSAADAAGGSVSEIITNAYQIAG